MTGTPRLDGRKRPRLAIVSLHANDPFTPRGERTRRLAEALADDWEVEVIGAPGRSADEGQAPTGSSLVRRIAAGLLWSLLLDRWELWSIRRLARWRPEVDAALLIAYPFAPPVWAARRLVARSIPYVVDAGDPWVLTNPDPLNRLVARWRARRAERFLWEHAAGAVVTTEPQRRSLRKLFPDLPVLVRPNGYAPPADPAPARRASTPESLRIVHFGMLSVARLDVDPLLRSLCGAGIWRSVTFAQFGEDYAGMLERVPRGVEVERHRAYPWDEVIERATDYDLALVVGNVNPAQLPSKAVQYLTLPIPRAVLTLGTRDDALADYAGNHTGWIVLTPEQDDSALRVRRHLERHWTPEELEPPAEESWAGVGRAVADFLASRVGRREIAR